MRCDVNCLVSQKQIYVYNACGSNVAKNSQFADVIYIFGLETVLTLINRFLVVNHCVSQDQRERKVTVDDVPSGIYLYPEEEPAVDNIFTPVSSRSSAALFEEAQKEILKLMKIEVSLYILFKYCFIRC